MKPHTTPPNPSIPPLTPLTPSLTLSDFNITSQIASGGTATVLLATPRPKTPAAHLPPQLALRTVRKHHQPTPNLHNELLVHRLVHHHPNIVTLHAFFESPHSYNWVLELLQGPDLFDFIAQKGTPLTEHQALLVTEQLLSALEHMHTLGCAHRDIKPENIVFAQIPTSAQLPPVKLVDFGLATYAHPHLPREQRKSRLSCGTVGYAAPEVVKGFAYVPEESDMWSVGALLFGLVARGFPFGRGCREEFLRDFEGGVWFDERFEGVSEGTRELIRRCLGVDWGERPRAAEARREVWRILWGLEVGGIRAERLLVERLERKCGGCRISCGRRRRGGFNCWGLGFGLRVGKELVLIVSGFRAAILVGRGAAMCAMSRKYYGVGS